MDDKTGRGRLTPDQVVALARLMQGIEVKETGAGVMAEDLANVNTIVKELADNKRSFFDVPGAHAGVLLGNKTKGGAS